MEMAYYILRIFKENSFLNDVHLRAKRRGKGGKYKKNSDQEKQLSESEVIVIVFLLRRKTISCCRETIFLGGVSSEAHSI